MEVFQFDMAKCDLFIRVHFRLLAHVRCFDAASDFQVNCDSLFPLFLDHKHLGTDRVDLHSDGKLPHVNSQVGDYVSAVDQGYMLFFCVMPLGFADQLEYLVDEQLPMAILFAACSRFV